jgi:hypothetical protein
METDNLIEWARTTEFKSPQKLSCGVVKDVDYFVDVQILRIERGTHKEQLASIDRLKELKKVTNGS